MAMNMQPRVFTLDPESTAFSSHFDMVQEQLETLASMDDLSLVINTMHNTEVCDDKWM